MYFRGVLLIMLLAGVLMMVLAARQRKVVRVRPPVVLAPDVEMRVRDLIARRRKIAAIKVVREHSGLGLKDAKNHADAIEAGHPLDLRPGPFGGSGGPPGHGPAGMVAPATRARAEQVLAQGALIKAIELVQKESGLGLKEAKDYCEALRDGRLPPVNPLPERARALTAAGDHAAAVALVRDETGVSQSEAETFLDGLE